MNRQTSAAKAKKIVLRPWDLLRGLDVFRDRSLFNADLSYSTHRHWAPNCSTFSRARERPIPGVLFPRIPFRSDSEPRGIESVLNDLPPSKRRKVTLDTDMADLAAHDCISAFQAGRKFSLEHPKNSIARKLESWQELEGMVGVEKTEYHACMFQGCFRRKSQILFA